MSDHKDFPKWMYHKDAGSRLFNTQQDLDAAGNGWFDSPEEVARQERKEPNVGAETSNGVVGARGNPADNDGERHPPYQPKPADGKSAEVPKKHK